ncbi:uncharacterized protein LOC131947755 [Physella acuta]|uniref:uncharacterized protein LOC131947755 n=1 Tax=Physella acuta TaxID=109671 RepID=UPI0027DAFB80|nr:uncharacterized protein LOC131947755 [Physella acuta]XP_059165034.1 uncharacterized protein LOC131947755 [Physella acuta]
MGANQSNGELGHESCRTLGDNPYQTASFRGHHSVDGLYPRTERKIKAKPSQPGKPVFTEVTHDTISLTWAPPRSDSGNILAYTIEIANMSPCGDRQWKTVTKACQGTSYDIRHLASNTEYVFRVRAENVYGIGKPSVPSDIVVTNMFETLANQRTIEVTPVCAVEEVGNKNVRRRHSFNIHLDGGITNILNHSDIVLKTSSSRQSSTTNDEMTHTLTRGSIHRTSLKNRKISQPILLPGTGTNSLNRLKESRNSLRNGSTENQTVPKKSARNRHRDSRSSVESGISDSNTSSVSTENLKKSGQDSQSSRGSIQSNQSDMTVSNTKEDYFEKGSKNSLCYSNNSDDHCDGVERKTNCDSTEPNFLSTFVSTTNNNNWVLSDYSQCLKVSDTESDRDIYNMADGLKKFEITEENLKFHNLKQKLNGENLDIDSLKGYYDHLENPWQKDGSVNGVSEQIMAAPLCDDAKMARMALIGKGFLEGDNLAYSDSAYLATSIYADNNRDFRTLRSVLQSDNMIVKSARSLPDVMGMILGEKGEARVLTRGKLTTIDDADEDEDAVRVTTL